jgi:hypothetical protein
MYVHEIVPLTLPRLPRCSCTQLPISVPLRTNCACKHHTKAQAPGHPLYNTESLCVQLASQHPELFPKDVVEKAKKLCGTLKLGAYTTSVGHQSARDAVAEGITARDGHKADPDLVFLSSARLSLRNTCYAHLRGHRLRTRGTLVLAWRCYMVKCANWICMSIALVFWLPSRRCHLRVCVPRPFVTKSSPALLL